MSEQNSSYGRLITLEGTEGAGKSTLLQALKPEMERWRGEVLFTREPGGSALGEKIRELLLKESMPAWSELFLYEAARADHWEQVIQPALKAGKWVLCDRFTDSSLAYQSAGRGLNWENVHLVNQLATGSYEPDLSLFLDLPPEEGLKRVQDSNRFDQEEITFHKKVRNGFFQAIQMNPKRWVVLSVADRTLEELVEETLKALQSRFGSSLS